MKTGGTNVGAAVRGVLRILLSGLFTYAGISKMYDVRAFADSVASFHLLPDVLLPVAALTLPPLEIAAALLVLSVGRWRQAGVFCLLALLAIFTVALASALARGLPVDCGCFGTSHFDPLSPTKNLWLALGRDLVLGVAAGWLYADSVNLQRPSGQVPSCKATRPDSVGADGAMI